MIDMRRRGYREKGNSNRQDNSRFTRPSDKRFKMSAHPGTNAEEQEKTPQGDTQEAETIHH